MEGDVAAVYENGSMASTLPVIVIGAGSRYILKSLCSSTAQSSAHRNNNQKRVTPFIHSTNSGLSAARHLVKHGKSSVVVLEARQRHGGRVWTNTDMGFPVDLGAFWIHGKRVLSYPPFLFPLAVY